MRPILSLLMACAVCAARHAAAAETKVWVTPASVLATAPAADWARPDPATLLVMELGHDRVVIALAPAFAPVHVANIGVLARAHWWDGLAIERVQDGYVTQWGDADGRKQMPHGLVQPAPAEYERTLQGLAVDVLPYRDAFADHVGFVGGLPMASGGGRAWLAHCYGMVGVGRDLTPDTGTGAELYAVIGQSPRALDRNIALVGRVLDGMDVLAALPRGHGQLGFYTSPTLRPPIRRVRLASDLPPGERPALEVLRTDSPSFRAWVHARANRHDDFYSRPADALDLCNALPPVRPAR
jgi:peptidylprolyl isomerase